MRIALLVCCALLWMGSLVKDTFVIQHKEIIVKGNTSLGSFECSYDNKQLGDTLIFENEFSDNNRLDFVIPVRDFGCGNFILNSDFRKTLKAEEYPTCKVTVHSLVRNKRQIYGNISIKMAGNEMDLSKVIFSQLEDKLQGKIQLSFKELALEAPHRMGGLVRVEEILDLEINLYLDPA